MRRMRGVCAVGKDVITTILLIYDEETAWIRFKRDATDVELSQEEVRELAKVFRQAVELWDRKEVKKP